MTSEGWVCQNGKVIGSYPDFKMLCFNKINKSPLPVDWFDMNYIYCRDFSGVWRKFWFLKRKIRQFPVLSGVSWAGNVSLLSTALLFNFCICIWVACKCFVTTRWQQTPIQPMGSALFTFFLIYILQLDDNLPDMVTTYDRDPRSLNLRMKYLDTCMYMFLVTIIYCVYNNDLSDILILIIDDLVSPQLLVAVIIF